MDGAARASLRGAVAAAQGSGAKPMAHRGGQLLAGSIGGALTNIPVIAAFIR